MDMDQFKNKEKLKWKKKGKKSSHWIGLDLHSLLIVTDKWCIPVVHFQHKHIYNGHHCLYSTALL